MGTVLVNKKGLASYDIFPKAGRHKRDRGAMKCMSKDLGQCKCVYFTAWMDSKPGHLLHPTKPLSSDNTACLTEGYLNRLSWRTISTECVEPMGLTSF